MKVKELLAKQVAFEEAIWGIKEIIWSGVDVIARSAPLVAVLDENSRPFHPRNWREWGSVSLPATVEEEDLEVVETLIEMLEAADIPDRTAYEQLKRVADNAKRECPWAEQAFGQRYLYEQVERLAGSEDAHSVLANIFEATEPSHPTAGLLSKAVFNRLAMSYPVDEYPEMILIAKNVLATGFLTEQPSVSGLAPLGQ